MAQGVLARRFGSGSVLAIGHLSEALLPFVRSIAMARLMSPANFGIGIAISTTAAVVELFTDIGLDRMAVRAAAHGNSEHYLKTLHAVQLARGCLNAVILAVLGPVLAVVVGAPKSGLLFSSLGLICLAKGLTNYERKQAMQRYVYWPEGVTILGNQIGWTVATILFAFWLRDARAMAFGIMAGQAVALIMAHGLAKQPYRFGWDRAIVKEALSYGLPLIPSSMATAANGLLDRFIVSGALGPAVLGLYTAALMMTVMPRVILSRLLNNLAIPAFINKGSSGTEAQDIFNAWAIIAITSAFLVAVAAVCLTRPVLFLIYGARFVATPLLSALIAADLIPKFLICLAGTPALALGHTKALLRYTMLTLPALGIAAIGVWFTHRIEGFAGGMLAADCVSMTLIVYLAMRQYPYSRRLVWVLLAGALGLLALPALAVLNFPGRHPLDPGTLVLHIGAGAVSVIAFAAILFFVVDRRHFRDMLSAFGVARSEPSGLGQTITEA